MNQYGDLNVGGGSGNPDWFDQNHPDQLRGAPNDPAGGTGGGPLYDQPVDPVLNASDPHGGELGPETGGGTGGFMNNGGGSGWWNDPNFGAPATPYASTPWAGGPAPTFTKPGAAPTYAAYGGAVPTYRGPGAAPTFTAPTAADMENDPGYQFRLSQGNQALNRGFAAGGTLLNGGTAKALARYNQDYASGEFQNVYNRAQGNFAAANTTYGNNANAALNQFGAENTTYGRNVTNAQDAFGAANTTYMNDATANQNDFNNQNTNYQTRYGQYLGDNARTLSDWLQNLTAKRNAESDYWARLSGVSGSGLSAATQGQGA